MIMKGETMEKTTCDKCKSSFQINPSVAKLGAGIERTYIKCTHCGEEYTAFLTDEKIRKLQARQRHLVMMSRSLINRGNGKLSEKYSKEFTNNKREIGRLMDALQRQYA